MLEAARRTTAMLHGCGGGGRCWLRRHVDREASTCSSAFIFAL
jgi:hypothetical protein